MTHPATESLDIAACPVGTSSFDFADPQVAADLWSRLAELRSCPAIHSDRYGGYWAITGFDDVRREASEHEHLSSAAGATIPNMDNPLPAIPLESDPPEHTVYRKLLLPLFKPKQVLQMEDDVRALVRQLMDDFVTRGHANLMTDFADEIAPRVIALLLGISNEDMKEIVAATEQMMLSAFAEDAAAKSAALERIDSTLRKAVVARLADPKDDLTSLVAHAEINGERLAEDKAVAMLHLVALAGHTTTIHGIGNMLYLLATHPDSRARLLADRSLVEATIEESLRYEPPILMMGRTAISDFDVDGVRITAGERVGLMFGSANRDERVFDDPDEFQIDRSPNRHLAFGSGSHRCIGEHLARLEMKVALEEVLDRIPDYQIAPDAEIAWNPSFNRGLLRLPVTFSTR